MAASGLGISHSIKYYKFGFVTRIFVCPPAGKIR